MGGAADGFVLGVAVDDFVLDVDADCCGLDLSFVAAPATVA